MEMLRMHSDEHSRISFDANDYRLLRIEELRLSALTAAEKVKRTGSAVPLQPHEQPRAARDPPGAARRNGRAQRKRGRRPGAAGGGVSGGHGQPARARRPRPCPQLRAPAAHATAGSRRSPPRARGAARQVRRRGISLNLNDTIVAISTPPGRGGLGVVRLSGERARGDRREHPRVPRDDVWRPWRAHLAELLDAHGHTGRPGGGDVLRSPRSYTAEDVVEISCHGSPVVLRHARGARPRRPARVWPSPASSPCALFSTAASICRRPKPCAT